MIPYTVERRADTGVTNVTLGIWLFLASEVMLFGALFSAYALLRVSAPEWPSGRDVLNIAFGALNTAVLVVMTTLVWRARGTGRASARLIAAASALAVLFLAIKAVEYRGEMAAGLVPSVSTFLAMYFTLTGLHALHVAGGLVANIWVIAGVRRAGAAMTAGRLHALALYWLFVDAVWLVIFPVMYLT
jgi:heme/copper-type cytochrome/quinol oxidase subunit 3